MTLTTLWLMRGRGLTMCVSGVVRDRDVVLLPVATCYSDARRLANYLGNLLGERVSPASVEALGGAIGEHVHAAFDQGAHGAALLTGFEPDGSPKYRCTVLDNPYRKG